jgi:antitoxin component of MazEF toxin-antitoxin module
VEWVLERERRRYRTVLAELQQTRSESAHEEFEQAASDALEEFDLYARCQLES